ncbi:MAG: PEP-CTERM sorting domain-containing protein [Candidatus Thiodiazotropha sp.]|nr:MAG: hypothetical protein DBP03_18310 [gamma proteobacterium symbiont of Ctena orbiculata]
MNRLIWKISLLTLLFLPVSPVNAKLIEADWDRYAYDNNLLTYDTDTGLYWLDLSVTTGLSYNFVEDLISDGTLGEFTHASISQLREFHTNAGLDFGRIAMGREEAILAANFASMLGVTPALSGYGSYGLKVNGMLSDEGFFPYRDDDHLIATLSVVMSPIIPENHWEYNYDFAHIIIGPEHSNNYVGHYLVSASVPEPSTLLLLGAGIIGIGATRIRRKTN